MKIATTFLMSRFLVGGPGATGSDEESGQARKDRLDRRSAPHKAHKNTISTKPEPKQAKKTRKQQKTASNTDSDAPRVYWVITLTVRWAKKSM